MAVRFVHDQFLFDPDRNRFLLLEPPALFDEPPDRVSVQAWRHREGWHLLYTHQFDSPDGLGVLDLWSNAAIE